MYPQSLSLPSPHFPQAFAEGAALPRRAVCAGGKSYHIDPSTGQPVCLCQLSAASPLAMSGPATHNSPNHSPVSVHLPPFTASRAGLPEHFAAAGLGKDHPPTRSIPIGGPYTPTAFAAYHPYLYAGYEMGGIRKAAVRETTGPLKAWLHEHKKNPYPTKAEKVMLAIITQMTLTQVSTWFANARRRLKKESRGSCEGGVDNDNVEDKDEDNSDHYENLSDVSVDGEDNEDTAPNVSSTSSQSTAASSDSSRVVYLGQPLAHPEFLPLPPPRHHQHHFPPLFVPPLRPLLPSLVSLPPGTEVTVEGSQTSGNGGSGGGHASTVASHPATKPRIWSISAIIGLDKEESNANVCDDDAKDKAGKPSGCGGSGSNSKVTSAGSSVQHVESDGTDSGIGSEEASHRSPGSPGSVCSPRSSSSPQSSPIY